ncbi:MAG: hypothetical protein J2P25_16645 [Nocardiopsaceae bacterium]|nr:hypothetical protein [Nocardiopsaceae bacterium]
MQGDWGGIILALFIGLGLALVYNKGRKKFGKPANGKTLIWATVIIAIILVLLFDAHSHP